MTNHRAHGARGAFRRGQVLLALALGALIAWAALPAFAASSQKSQENPADAPVRRLLSLLTRKNVSVSSLRKAEGELARARNVKPDGLNGAKASFFLARARQEIAKRSGRQADWTKAADTFGECADRFPQYALAPDALLHRGTIRLEQLGDADGAQADFTTITRDYSKSRHAATAAQMLRRIPKSTSSAGRKATQVPQEAAPADGPQTDDGKATLTDVRPKTGPTAARVVIDLDGRVKYRYQVLHHESDKGGRIYVDLPGTAKRSGLANDVRVGGGVLRRVRVALQKDGDLRVVMDFAELADYRVTALDSPFRLVVDAFASKAAKAATPAPGQNDDDAPSASSYALPKGSSKKKLAADLVEQLGLSVHTIMIDAGHGGKDPGAQGNGLREKDITLRMALILGKVLKKRGYRVLYTRTTDDFIALDERTSMANAKKVDLFISVHCNAITDPSVHGLETYSLNLARTPDAVRVASRENSVSDSRNISDLQMILTDLMLNSKIKESLDLAKGVQRESLSALRGKWSVADHGNREAPFYVLMGAKMPAVLVEMGYITNKTEAARLKSDSYLHSLADGIANGVGEYKQQIERFTTRR